MSFGTAWQRNYYAPVLLLAMSVRCCDTGPPTALAFMQRSISVHFVDWPCLGQEVRYERVTEGTPGIPSVPARSWSQTHRRRATAQGLREVHGSARCHLHYLSARLGVGDASTRHTSHVGTSVHRC